MNTAMTTMTEQLGTSIFINTEGDLSIDLCSIPPIKTNEDTQYCVQYVLFQIQQLLIEKEKIDIILHITNDIKMEMFKTIKLFFGLFKKELPNKLNKCRIYTKAKYKGLAGMLLTFADRETKERMEILNL